MFTKTIDISPHSTNAFLSANCLHDKSNFACKENLGKNEINTHNIDEWYIFSPLRLRNSLDDILRHDGLQ